MIYKPLKSRRNPNKGEFMAHFTGRNIRFLVKRRYPELKICIPAVAAIFLFPFLHRYGMKLVRCLILVFSPEVWKKLTKLMREGNRRYKWSRVNDGRLPKVAYAEGPDQKGIFQSLSFIFSFPVKWLPIDLDILSCEAYAKAFLF